jgi:hypothetical protein
MIRPAKQAQAYRPRGAKNRQLEFVRLLLALYSSEKVSRLVWSDRFLVKAACCQLRFRNAL